MRLYSVTNMYTSGIHAGIQTAHLVHEMADFIRLRPVNFTVKTREVYYDWSMNHKTIIVLNGGYHANLVTVSEQFSKLGRILALPYASFNESVEALNGAMTATGIVVPPSIYEYDPDTSGYFLYDEELELFKLIKSFPLAK